MHSRKKRRVGDIESLHPSVAQSIADTAAQVEPIFVTYTSPVIGEVSPTDPRIRPADYSLNENLFIDEEVSQKNSKL